MLIYNKEWLDNFTIQNKAKSWLKKKLITVEEHRDILNQYSTGYSEGNIFARIGLFIFTLIIANSAVGLFNLLFFSGDEMSMSIQCIFFGGLSYFLAEKFTRSKNYFRSGVLDALLYFSVFCVSLGVILLISGKNYSFSLDPIIYISVVLPFIIFPAIRYSDAFLALLAYAGIFILNALLVLKAGGVGKMILPFEGMIFSFVAWRVIKNTGRKEEHRFWSKSILTLEAASLITFYASGNYFVVRQLSEILLHENIAPGSDIHLAYFFYAFTIAVSLLYTWIGLKQKEYTLIRLGLLLEAAGILSIRYYHSILPVETAMILSGIILVTGAWASIQYLRSPKHGISYLEDSEATAEAFDAIGTVIVSQTISKTLPGNQNKFGGGGSGGAGAGGEF
jgi:hypothetical protein